MSLARSLAPLFAATAALALAACSRPEPPTVTPVSGRVTGISTSGIDIAAKLEAFNPNDFDLSVKSYTVSVILDHQIHAGTVTSAHGVDLPARKKKVFEVPISVKWNDVAAIVPLALGNRDIPFEADGKVMVGGSVIDVAIPFKVGGVVTHQQISQAVGKAIPKIPGLPL
jgi:LEA14-like dessication related protein